MSYTDIHYYLHYLGIAAYKDDALMVLGIKEQKDVSIPGNLSSMTTDSWWILTDGEKKGTNKRTMIGTIVTSHLNMFL